LGAELHVLATTADAERRNRPPLEMRLPQLELAGVVAHVIRVAVDELGAARGPVHVEQLDVLPLDRSDRLLPKRVLELQARLQPGEDVLVVAERVPVLGPRA